MWNTKEIFNWIEIHECIWISSFQNFKRFFDNAIFSNQGSSCKETFSCNGVLGFLYFRVNELTKSTLQIHAIVAGANLIETYDFEDNKSTYLMRKWFKSSSSEIIIDYTAFNQSSNYTLEVECRNIELLHNQDALVYFQRKFYNNLTVALILGTSVPKRFKMAITAEMNVIAQK